ncbi:MAG TPA: AmmeMemoRadiSam system protein B [Candidatus Saccharimonadales bacterium]|nr:AmmeMemoRadiSam system protein B [Candidatus Saccharimonadales bacterium]
MTELIRTDEPQVPGSLRPRIRPLEVAEVQEGDQQLLVLSDPLRLVEDSVVLPASYLPILELLDGASSVDELGTLLVRETGDLSARSFLCSLVGRLDELLLLDSPRFREAWQAFREEYHRLPTREAALAGVSYPDEPGELRTFLAGLQEQARGWRAAEPSADGAEPPAALVAPHIDLRRGGGTLARAYLEWEDSVPRIVAPGREGRPPEIVVAFGTGHSVVGSRAVLTAKDFETPLGAVPACRPVVDALGRALGDGLFAEEIAHREEHSLEFQALFLAELMARGARFELVPILCGSFQGYLEEGRRPAEDEEVARLVEALRAALREAGRPVRFVAGVDFSHVGPRFGDRWELNPENLRRLEEQDRAVIEAALTGDAEKWFEAIAVQDDSTHICGFSAVYLMLRAMGEGRGRLLRYEQSPEEESQSVVTYAALAYRMDSAG